MSEDPDQPSHPVAAPPSPPPPAALEKTFVKLAIWQNALAFIGILVALIALYAALTESAAVRQQTAASVWPFLQLSIADYSKGEEARFEIRFANVGVGPAKVAQLQLLVKGQPVSDLAALVDAVGGSSIDVVDRNYLTHRVVSPGEEVMFLSTEDSELARKLQAMAADPSSALRYCYCSIFDACWIVDSRSNVNRPELVDACPDFGERRFRL